MEFISHIYTQSKHTRKRYYNICIFLIFKSTCFLIFSVVFSKKNHNIFNENYVSIFLYIKTSKFCKKNNGEIMYKNNNTKTSRLQIRIPVELKKQLENVTDGKIMGIQSTKSLIVSIALANLFKTMQTSSLEDICVNTYISLFAQGDD